MEHLKKKRFIFRTQVIVVGAGMAGLSATRELRSKGWPEGKVLLLEASDTIGGRVR